MSLGPGGEKGKWNYCLVGTVFIWEGKKVLEMGSSGGCTTVEVCLMALN